MKHFILGAMSALLLLLPAMMGYAAEQQTAPAQSSTIQIVLAKDAAGHPKPMVIDANGVKSDLTLGTLLDATAESWINGPVPTPKVDPDAIALIKVYKEGGKLKTYLEDGKGRHEPLSLGNLLAGSAEMYPGCSAKQIDGKSLNIKLNFKLNADHIETRYVSSRGTELLNLGTLVRVTTVKLNTCKGHNSNM